MMLKPRICVVSTLCTNVLLYKSAKEKPTLYKYFNQAFKIITRYVIGFFKKVTSYSQVSIKRAARLTTYICESKL